MTGQRVLCSAAPRWRDHHQVGARQFHLTTPRGELFTFCSAACLLSFAVFGLADDVEVRHTASSGAA